MSDTTHNTFFDEDEPADQPASSSTMVFTLLLLIGGLLLSSFLMLDHAKEKTMETADSESLSRLMLSLNTRMKTVVPAQKRSPSEQEKPTPKQTAETGKESGLSFSRLLPKSSGWPRLKLIGFGSSATGKENFAIINGQKVHPGGMVNGVKVLEVRSSDVLVEFQGERKTLTVQMTD